MNPRLTALFGIALIALAGCGGTASTGGSISQSSTTVDLKEWKVSVPSNLKAGKVSFDIKNDGAAEHELLVFKSSLDVAQYPTDAAGNINEEASAITKVSDGDNIAAGHDQTRTIDLSQPGTYVFVCNLPGHFKSGMKTVVTVTS